MSGDHTGVYYGLTEAQALFCYLLEVNVLNPGELKRELANIGARAINPMVKTWLLKVAYNYIVNLEPGAEEYEQVTGKPPLRGGYTGVPLPTDPKFPDWAKRDIEQKRAIHFFNVDQPRKRQVWKDIEMIVDWFNTLKPTDNTFKQITAVRFEDAKRQATDWHKGLTACIRCGQQQSAHQNGHCPGQERGEERSTFTARYWVVMPDRSPVVTELPDGWRWVAVDTEKGFKREGAIMNACQYSHWRQFANGDTILYSLRDPQNIPHITIEINAHNRRTNEIKGTNNQKPVQRYQQMLRDFIRAQRIVVASDAGNVDPEPRAPRRRAAAAPAAPIAPEANEEE